MARLVIYALTALATRAYDWTTPGDALTPFDCDAYPNPIQVFKADNQNPPYNVSELDLATGKYNKICDFPKKYGGVNGFALMQYPDGGPQPGLKDNVYSFVCRGKKLERFDCASVSELDGTLIAQKEGTTSFCNAATFVGTTYYYTNGLRGKDNQIYRVTAMETDAPDFKPRGDAQFNVSDSVLRGAENDITSLEEASSGAFAELINDGLPGRKYVVGLAANPNFKGGNVELFVARLEEEKDAAGNIINPYGAPEAYAVLYTKCVNVDWSGRPGGVPSANGCIQSTFGAAYTYDEGTSTSSSITQPPRLFFSNNAGLGLFEVIIPAGGVLCGNQP